MSFLNESSLPDFYPEAANMSRDNVIKFLNRANGYVFGVIGGIPTYSSQLPEDQLKTAVAMAFEIFAEGQEAQTNHVNGNITEAAPAGYYVRKADSPLEVVEKMLLPYAEAFKRQNTMSADNGVMFI